MLQVLELLRGREAGGAETSEQPALSLVQQLPLESVGAGEAVRGHQPLQIVRARAGGRRGWPQSRAEVEGSWRRPVSGQGGGCKEDS